MDDQLQPEELERPSFRLPAATLLNQCHDHHQKRDQDDYLLNAIPPCVLEFWSAFFLHRAGPRDRQRVEEQWNVVGGDRHQLEADKELPVDQFRLGEARTDGHQPQCQRQHDAKSILGYHHPRAKPRHIDGSELPYFYQRYPPGSSQPPAQLIGHTSSRVAREFHGNQDNPLCSMPPLFSLRLVQSPGTILRMKWVRLIVVIVLLVPVVSLASAASSQHTGMNFWWALTLGAAIGVFFSFVFGGNPDWKIWDSIFGSKESNPDEDCSP